MLNQFKTPYQTNSAPTQNNNDMIWVQGESGAKAYLVAPNTTVTLWDSENPIIYLKTANNTGVPSMRILDYTERTSEPKEAQHNCKCAKEFAPIEDFKKLENKLEELTQKVNNIMAEGETDNG